MLGRIDHAPRHEVVDDQILLFTGEELLLLMLVIHDAVRVAHDVLHERHFEMQAGLVVRLDDLAELELQGVVPLVDGEHRHAYKDHDDDGDDQQEVHAWTHGASLLAD